MINLAFGLLFLFCISIIIYAIKVYREDTKSVNDNKHHFEDDDELIYRRK